MFRSGQEAIENFPISGLVTLHQTQEVNELCFQTEPNPNTFAKQTMSQARKNSTLTTPPSLSLTGGTSMEFKEEESLMSSLARSMRPARRFSLFSSPQKKETTCAFFSEYTVSLGYPVVQ
jgi:hypothetical protein